MRRQHAARLALVALPLAVKLGCGLVLYKLLALSMPADTFGRTVQAMALVAMATGATGGAAGPALTAALAAPAGRSSGPARLTGAAICLSAMIGLGMMAAALLTRPVWQPLTGAAGAMVPAALAAGLAGSVLGGVRSGVLAAQRRQGAIAAIQSAGWCMGLAVAAPAAASGNPAVATAGFCAFAAATGLFSLVGLAACMPDRAALAVILRGAAARLVAILAVPLALVLARAEVAASAGWPVVALWIAAQRLAEPLAQLVGLVNIQLVLPAVASRRARPAAMAVRIAGAIAGALAVLWLAGPALIALMLDDHLASGRGALGAYLAGDGARMLAASLAAMLMARGRAGGYLAVELAAAAALVAAAGLVPPQLAVLGAGSVALVVAVGLCGAGGRAGQVMKSSGPISAGSRP